jgi:hypothetical protein
MVGYISNDDEKFGFYNEAYNSNYSPDSEEDSYITLPLYKSTYYYLIEDLLTIFNNLSLTKESCYSLYKYYLSNNDTLWNNLYKQYSQFLYEGRYDNTDEIDYISLYNQAIIYYQDFNKPAGNYSISVLDLSVLESISTPRLKIGSKIKVYNAELGLNESNGDNTALNELQYTPNDLIVTSLKFDLRKSGDVNIGVARVTSYVSILQKLIKSVK